jgi:hypothetical protein
VILKPFSGVTTVSVQGYASPAVGCMSSTGASGSRTGRCSKMRAADPRTSRGTTRCPGQHVLLHRGLIAAEQLLPGLREDLVRAGAVPIDTGDLLWLGPSGWSVPGGREFEVLAATRPLLEHILRSRVAALPHVERAGVPGAARGRRSEPSRAVPGGRNRPCRRC